ncbi:universal stress protein [Agromyces bauzanensis]|uniref:Universal stress protein n=1 Tax=Agromyces bauzanensis TaxID=1308924 RepID=A0A917URP9_9MICO|nr:universal stress protein [Agromyces bauzanensis]GGJ80335.1 universal stress protein [Agromyces bauzanensis]
MAETPRDPNPPEPSHEPEPGPPGVIVGVDGSESSVAALRYAADLAPKLGLRVRALAVWNYPVFIYGGYYPQIDWTPEDDAERIVARSAEEVFGTELPEWFATRIRLGRPAETLIDESRYAEMLVVGSRGHGGFAGLLLGSVSAACAEHAHCPVLVVHGR